MLGSYSKAELVKTLADQICPLQNHPLFPHSTSGLPSRYSFSLFLFHLWYLFFPHLLHREIILHYLLSAKVSVGFSLINLMAHFLAIKILKIEGTGLAHPFCFHARVMGILAFRVDRLSELIESNIYNVTEIPSTMSCALALRTQGEDLTRISPDFTE